MNAVTDTTATEIAQLHGSLDALLSAIINLDAMPRTRPMSRTYSAEELIESAYAELRMSEHQRFTSRLVREPVREALCHAVRRIGHRLNEIGGLAAMHDAMRHIEDLDDGGVRRVSIIDKRWDGVGNWFA